MCLLQVLFSPWSLTCNPATSGSTSVCCFPLEPVGKKVSHLSSVLWKHAVVQLFSPVFVYSLFPLLILPQGFMDGGYTTKQQAKGRRDKHVLKLLQENPCSLSVMFEWQLLLVTSPRHKRINRNHMLRHSRWLWSGSWQDLAARNYYSISFASSLKLVFWAGIPKLSQGLLLFFLAFFFFVLTRWETNQILFGFKTKFNF